MSRQRDRHPPSNGLSDQSVRDLLCAQRSMGVPVAQVVAELQDLGATPEQIASGLTAARRARRRRLMRGLLWAAGPFAALALLLSWRPDLGMLCFAIGFWLFFVGGVLAIGCGARQGGRSQAGHQAFRAAVRRFW